MLNLSQFLLKNMMMEEKNDLHMIRMPQVQMITQFHCQLQRNSSRHKEHQNWYASERACS